MISSLIDAVLLTALAATSFCVILMYRRLQRFDALQGEAAKAFVRSAQALENARLALETLHDNGGELTFSLAARLNEARLVINELEQGTATRGDALRRESVRRETMQREATAEAARRAAAAAGAATAPAEPEIDFTDGWADRFDGLGQKTTGQRVSQRGAKARSHSTIEMETAPLPDSQSLALSWRAIAGAAQRAS